MVVNAETSLKLTLPRSMTKVTKLETVQTPPAATESNLTYTHVQVAVLPKRKTTNIVPQSQKAKKVKFCHYTDPSAPTIQLNNPLSTQWHNNSCAYDAIITVLFNIWYDPNPEMPIEDTQCVMFNALIQSFRTHERHQVDSRLASYTLQQIHDFFRRQLARISQDFTFGSYACVQAIGDHLFRADEIITTSNVFCPDGHSADRLGDRRSSTSSYQILILDNTEISLQACIDNFTHQLASKCQTCDISKTVFGHRRATFM